MHFHSLSNGLRCIKAEEQSQCKGSIFLVIVVYFAYCNCQKHTALILEIHCHTKSGSKYKNIYTSKTAAQLSIGAQNNRGWILSLWTDVIVLF